MTALTISTQIPTNINTVEKLIAWAALLYTDINPTLKRLESENSNQPVSTSSITKAYDGTTLLTWRVSIPLASTLYTDTSTKAWQKATENSTIVIPTGYTSN
jgi:hypothetical protein